MCCCLIPVVPPLLFKPPIHIHNYQHFISVPYLLTLDINMTDEDPWLPSRVTSIHAVQYTVLFKFQNGIPTLSILLEVKHKICIPEKSENPMSSRELEKRESRVSLVPQMRNYSKDLP